MKSRKTKGFTLVEILIVVVILGILAAIVIPQFTNASTEAKESSLVSNLQAIRSQIELYKIHHNDTLPADAAALTTGLTTQTDVSGGTVDAGEIAYGPYMKNIPANPFSGDSTANIVTGDGTSPTANDDWYYTNNGDGTYDFGANDAGTNSVTGVAHSAY
jgi:type II secretion system protein G